MSAPPNDSAGGGPSDLQDRASRILVLSLGSGNHLAPASLQNLIQAIKGASPATTAPEDEDQGDAVTASGQPDAATSQEASSFEYRVDATRAMSSHGDPVPWKISNRYYDAQVHFVARSIPIQRSRSGQPGSRASARAAQGSASREAAAPPTLQSTPQVETDEELRERARDVFAALAAPSRSAGHVGGRQPTTSAIADVRALKAIQEEARDVPAVVLVVDRGQPFSVHRDMLVALSTSSDDESVPCLSGHDLDVSLVLGIPGPMINAIDADEGTLSRSQGVKPTKEELSELYAQEGWEYVDLLSGAEADLYDEEGGMDDLREEGLGEEAIEDVGAGAEEEHGFDRVREALETHLWPGLVRKDDRASRLAERERRQAQDQVALGTANGLHADANFGGHLQSFSDFQDSLRDTHEELDGDSTERTERARADLNGSADARGVESAQDDVEEARLTALLDTVLMQLNGAQLGASETAPGGPRLPSNFEAGSAEVTEEDEALAKAFMEQIIRHEGMGQAPSTATTTGAQPSSMSRAREELEKFLDEKGGDEWLASGSGTGVGHSGTQAPAGSDGFDDDFADFVTAPPSIGNRAGASLGTIGTIRGTGAGGAALGAEEGEPDFDFANALQNVRAQAERVRAIQDPEQRRDEAARVALAFSNQLG